MNLFIFASTLLFIDTIFMIGFIYQAIRYKKNIFITSLFTSMLVIALLAYGIALATGEFETVSYQTSNISISTANWTTPTYVKHLELGDS